MNYVKEFRNSKQAKEILEKIRKMDVGNVTIMEVCGTHTMSIFKNGIRGLLPENIRLISGPGCPVCVTSQGYIDTAIMLSRKKEYIITTFGDMLRVPGTESSLQKEKARGCDVRMVYSPLDSLKIARENPEKEVIFLAIGFETTAPVIALSIETAAKMEIKNFSILQSIKTIPNTMEQLVMDRELQVDAFLCPGHVSTIIGVKPYEFLAEEYHVPAVIAGFEPVDIALGLLRILEMIEEGTWAVENHYNRLVSQKGSRKALEMMEKIFVETGSVWRGLGRIEGTGLKLREAYARFDAEEKLGIKLLEDRPVKGCLCGEILKGKATPLMCKLFAKACNPMNPVGACMVSEEGTCAAYYKYSDFGQEDMEEWR